MDKGKKRLSIQEIALFGVLGAVIWGAKLCMSWLPNIEPVSLLVMVYVAVFGKKAFYPIYIYVALDVLLYGLQLWTVNYLYIWAILAFAAMGLKNSRNPLAWAVLSGTFGLFFGALCAPVDLFIGGPGLALSKWISGIPFDLAHCVGNFCLGFLFNPLRGLLEKQYQKLLGQ